MSNDHNTSKIGDLIKVFFRQYGLEEKREEADLNVHWEKIAGEIVAKHTTSISLKDNKLILKLNSAALRHTLSFSKTEFIEKINESLGKDLVKDIVLK